MIAGTTGESATLSHHELFSLIEIAVAEAHHRIPIIAGTGSASTEEALKKTIAAKRLGADACLVVFPYYNRPTFEGCKAHFQKISECGLPTVAYHHPGRTGVRMTTKQLIEICSLPGVIAIKESSGDVDFALELIQSTDKAVISGDDSLTLPLIACGAKGVISIVGNVIPREWAYFVHCNLDGRLEEARRSFKAISPLCKSLVLETNPQCVKYAVSLIQKCDPFLRLPLLTPQETTKKMIGSALQAFMRSRSLFENVVGVEMG